MKKPTRMLALLLAAALAAVPAGVLAAEGEAEEARPGSSGLTAAALGEAVGQNGKLQMFLDEDAVLQIKNTETGSVWLSSPLKEDDSVFDEYILAQMDSQLIVRYASKRDEFFTVSSKVGSVDRGTYRVRKYKDGKGVLIEYEFTDNEENFTIPVQYRLEDDGSFRVEILYDKVEEKGEMRIVDIQLLPYFASGNQDTEGYLFVPDGSGSLIDFKDSNSWAAYYDESIYGRDLALTYLRDYTVKKQLLMPVYGAARPENGVFAIVEGAQANARIQAVQAGYTGRTAYACPTFCYRPNDITVLADKDSNSRSVTVISNTPIKENPSLKIYLLEGQDNSYNGMARIYRDYLMKEMGMKRLETVQDTSVSLEVMGMVKKPRSFFGLILNEAAVGTDFHDLEEILRDLEARGVSNAQLLLYGFQKGGMYDRYQTKLRFDSAVGGKSGYQKALETAKKSGAVLLPAYDPVSVYRGKAAFWNAAKTLDKQNLYQYNFYRSTGVRDESFRWFLMAPSKLPVLAETFMNSMTALETDAALLSSVGSGLYSDFSSSHYSERDQTKEAFTQLVERLAGKLSRVTIEGGNIYALYHADAVSEVPLSHSGYDTFSRRIPFYQMVLHGLVAMSSEPVNLMADQEQYLLQCMETGVSPSYRITKRETACFSDSKLDFIYNGRYADWADRIQKSAKDFIALHSRLQDQFIVSYEIQGELSVTAYEDGTQVICNFGRTDQAYGTITIPAGSAAAVYH